MAMPSQPRDVIVDTRRSPHAVQWPVPVSSVKLTDDFWQPRRETNRRVSIPSQYQQCEATGRLANFRRAAQYPEYAGTDFQGMYFNDSDVYKWVEAASWDLIDSPDDAEKRATLDQLIQDIANAQQPDGYLNTYFMFDRAKDRLTDFDKHELYCGGHLIQAAIAHHRVTGETTLLEVARKFADWIDRTIGPESEGKKPFVDGHQEVEMALIELYRETREPRYLKLAQFFLDQRGQNVTKMSPGAMRHHQFHVPLRSLREATGHAVRAVYYAASATDLVAETGERAIRDVVYAQLESMAHRRSYISGGIGSRWGGEAFGDDYELPDRAYAETCAAIGSIMWSWRLLLLDGDASHADRIEWTLYNAVLPGIGADGKHYFYQNPLIDDGTHRRCEWFGCACCPPNVARLLAQLPGYFFSTGRDREIFVHQYVSGSARIALGEETVELAVRSGFPRNGEVEMTVGTAGDFALMLRIPRWCREPARVLVNGEAVSSIAAPGSYLAIRRTWASGGVVRMSFPMTVERVVAHPRITNDAGKVALTRGPLLYAIEAADHPGVDVREIVLPDDAPVECVQSSEMLGNLWVLSAPAIHVRPRSEALYEDLSCREQHTPVRLTAIPYFAWANRAPGAMQVWIRRA